MDTRPKKILIIDDEAPIGELLKYGFEREGMEAKAVLNGADGLAAMVSYEPDLVILDLMLPDMDGMDICRRLTATCRTPIIILSAKNDHMDKLLGLEYGADDYITKPFDFREVLLRVRAILKRVDITKDEPEEEIIKVGNLEINMSKHEATEAGNILTLTPKEFMLLCVLARNKDKVLTRKQLLEDVWNFEYFGDTRTVDIHIQRLRKKIGDSLKIVTVFGVGYKLTEA